MTSFQHEAVNGFAGSYLIYNFPDVPVQKVYNYFVMDKSIFSLFRVMLEMMMPYIYIVSLNGMRMEGSKILDLGSGDQEAEMIKTIAESGFKCTIGIFWPYEG